MEDFAHAAQIETEVVEGGKLILFAVGLCDVVGFNKAKLSILFAFMINICVTIPILYSAYLICILLINRSL